MSVAGGKGGAHEPEHHHIRRRCGGAIVQPNRGVRSRANRRVAYVTSGSQKAVQPPLELPCVKSCAPIGASSKVDFGHLWTEGVGYARHRNRQKEVIDAHPTNYDDTGPSPLRATVFQTRLPTCSTVANRFDPCPRQEHRSLRP